MVQNKRQLATWGVLISAWALGLTLLIVTLAQEETRDEGGTAVTTSRWDLWKYCPTRTRVETIEGQIPYPPLGSRDLTRPGVTLSYDVPEYEHSPRCGPSGPAARIFGGIWLATAAAVLAVKQLKNPTR